MIRSISNPRGAISFLVLACAGLLLSGCPKKATNVAPEEEPPAPRYRAEPAQSPQPEASRVVPEERSEPAPLVFENVNFDYDRSELTAAARDILANHARLLRDNASVRILVEGHCDERGTIEYNLALGERRADTVLRYLGSLGVERSRLSTISYGKERPIDEGHSENSWFRNRRAEFKIIGR